MKPLKRRFEETLNTLNAYQTAVNEAAIVSITDLQGKILYVNEKFRDISGYSEQELIGNTHKIINSCHHSADFFKEMWQTISNGKPWRGEIKNRAKNGSFYWVDTVITPVTNSGNRIFQYLSIRDLITDRKENEEKLLLFQKELLKREQQLKDAQEVARVGSWYLKFQGNILEWSDEAYNIFGISPEKEMTYEQFLERVHPEDRMFVDKKWQSALKGDPYNIEHRIIVGRKTKWVKEKAHIEFDGGNTLVRAIGTVQDITEKKKIEISLKNSELLYRQLFDHIPVPVAIVDKETKYFLMINDAAKLLYGYHENEFDHLTLFDIRVENEHEQLQALLDNNLFTEDTSIRLHRKKNGEILQIKPVIKEIVYRGRPVYLIAVTDMTENLKMQRDLVRSKVKRQKEINKASMDAQEQNRAEIARELHDNVNQLLVASLIYLKTIHTLSEKDGETKKRALETLSNAMQEIRKLSQAMVPPSLQELNLQECIENISHDLRLLKIKVDFDISLKENEFDESFKVNIYRIIQEQFSNIFKYSEATYVKISLIQHANSLTLEITDNGKGFDVKTRSKGIGLTNIAHRAETYNGETVIESSPGKGCRVFIIFKLEGSVNKD